MGDIYFELCELIDLRVEVQTWGSIGTMFKHSLLWGLDNIWGLHLGSKILFFERPRGRAVGFCV